MTYFKLYLDSLELLEPLDDAERGRLLTALLQYAATGETPVLAGNERFLFPVFRRQFDRDQAEYDRFARKQRENGVKGGRPKTCKENPAVFSETQKSQDKDQDKNKNKDQDQDKDKDQDKDDKDAAAVAAVAAVAAAWGEKMGVPLSPRGRRELAEFVGGMGPACCLRAFDAALDAGRPTWAYVRGILRAKRDQGVRSPEDWDRLEERRARGKSGPCPGHDPQPSAERIQQSSGWLDAFLEGQPPAA